MKRAARVAGTLGLALAAALGCVALGTPLPWMIGPLLACAAATMAGAPTVSVPLLRRVGQWAIGTSLGLYFTPPVVAVLPGLLPAVGLGIVWALALAYGFYRYLWWRHGDDPALGRATAFFAASIGGASEMAQLTERHGGRVDLVAAAHSVRVMLVVVTIPFALKASGVHGADPSPAGVSAIDAGGLVALVALTLAAAWLTDRLGLPSPWVLGPLISTVLITALGLQLSAIPKVVTNFGQLFIGIALGTRFTPDFARAAPRWVASVVIGTLAMIVALVDCACHSASGSNSACTTPRSPHSASRSQPMRCPAARDARSCSRSMRRPSSRLGWGTTPARRPTGWRSALRR